MIDSARSWPIRTIEGLLSQRREAVRTALKAYDEALLKALDDGLLNEEDLRVSRTEVKSAQRVLWFES